MFFLAASRFSLTGLKSVQSNYRLQCAVAVNVQYVSCAQKSTGPRALVLLNRHSMPTYCENLANHSTAFYNCKDRTFSSFDDKDRSLFWHFSEPCETIWMLSILQGSCLLIVWRQGSLAVTLRTIQMLSVEGSGLLNGSFSLFWDFAKPFECFQLEGSCLLIVWRHGYRLRAILIHSGITSDHIVPGLIIYIEGAAQPISCGRSLLGMQQDLKILSAAVSFPATFS